MAFIEWNDLLSVGVAALDKEHKELFTLVNELYDAMKKGRGKDIMSKTVEGLAHYCQVHFAHEEKLFAKTNYPDAAAHIKRHDDFRKKVKELQGKCRGKASNADNIVLMNLLRKWLVNHVMTRDHKYTAHLNANGIK